MTGPSSQTILEAQKGKKYILAAAIRVSIVLQMTDDKCYVIYLTFSSLMEMQVTMSQRTTSHQ